MPYAITYVESKYGADEFNYGIETDSLTQKNKLNCYKQGKEIGER